MGQITETCTDLPQDVLDFWFSEQARPLWFAKDPAFDRDIRARFGKVYDALAAGQMESWRETADGVLAAVIVLDQFGRNMFRDTAKAFAADALAVSLADAAIAAGLDDRLISERRHFLYMPFMHSEDLADQDRCLALFSDLGNAEATRYAKLHRDIIARFGRFPHRNQILGRNSTAEELAFLTEPNSSF